MADGGRISQVDRPRLKTVTPVYMAPETERRVTMATGIYIGEGFDNAHRDTLFLAIPSRGRRLR
jgi:hypothetical protein